MPLLLFLFLTPAAFAALKADIPLFWSLTMVTEKGTRQIVALGATKQTVRLPNGLDCDVLAPVRTDEGSLVSVSRTIACKMNGSIVGSDAQCRFPKSHGITPSQSNGRFTVAVQGGTASVVLACGVVVHGD